MKRRIDISQLCELDDLQKRRLRTWWKPTEGDVYILTSTNVSKVIMYTILENISDESYKMDKLPLLDVIQMIEVLIDFNKPKNDLIDTDLMFSINIFKYHVEIENRKKYDITKDIDLCDTLWEQLKKVL